MTNPTVNKPFKIGPFGDFRSLKAFSTPGARVTHADAEVAIEDSSQTDRVTNVHVEAAIVNSVGEDDRVTNVQVEVPIEDPTQTLRTTEVYLEVPIYIPNDPESFGMGGSKRPIHIFRPYDLPTWPRYRRPAAYPTFGNPLGFQDVDPPLLVNPNSFYPPTITVAKNLAPGLLTNTNIFYSPSIHIGLLPGRLLNTSTFFSPTVRSTNAPLFPGRLVNLSSFFPPTIRSILLFPEEARVFKKRHYHIAGAQIPAHSKPFYGKRI